MKKATYSFIFSFFFIFLSLESFSATFYSRVSGNWNTPATWSTVSCGGTAAATTPGAADNVIICAGKTITMNGNPGSCLSLTIDGTANWTSTFTTNVGTGGLVLNNGGLLNGTVIGVLNVAGGFTVPSGAVSTIGNINLTVTGLTSISGSLNDNNTGGTNTFTNVDLNSTGQFNNSSSETYTITGNLNTYGGDFIATGGATIPVFNIGGNFNVVSGICDVSPITVAVSGITTISGTLDINNKKGIKTFNDLIVTSTGFFNSVVAEDYTINGNIQVNGTFTANLGIFTFAGAGKTITGATVMTFDDIICTGSYTNNASVKLTTSLTGAGNWTQGSTGTLDLGILDVNFTLTTFNAAPVGNTVIYSLAGAQNIRVPGDGSYSNLTISGGNTKTLLGSTTLGASLLISPTTTLASANYNLLVGGNFSNNGVFTQGTATVTLNGAVAQLIDGSTATAFNNLTISNSVAVVSAGTNFSVSGLLTIGVNSILSPNAAVLVSGAGTLTGSGTARVTRIAATPDFVSQYTITGKTLSVLNIDYIGAGNQSVNTLSYGSLTISTNGSRTVTFPAAVVGVSNIFSPSSVTTTYIVTGNTINFNGSTAQTIPAFNYNHLTSSSTGTRVLAAIGTIGIAGVFTPSVNVYTITGSTVDFNGSVAQSLPVFNYFNLSSSSTGARTLPAVGSIGVAGAFIPGTNVYTITSSTINYNGTAAQTIAAFNYNHLTSSSTGARTLAAAGTIGVAGVFTPSVNVYTITGSTINFNGTVAQTIPAFNYNHLTSSSTGARTLAAVGIIGIAGIFTPSVNVYTITGSTINFNGTGAQNIIAFNYNNLTSSSTGARTLASTGTIGVASTFTPGTNVYTITGSTIDFKGTVAQTIPTFNYNNLTSSSTGARTLASAGIIGVASTFTPGTNIYTITASTVEFNGTGAQNIIAFNYNNLTSSSSGTRTLASIGTIGVASTFTPGTNVYTITGSTIDFKGTVAQTIPTFNYNNLTSSSTGARTLSSSGTVGIASTFTPGTNVYTLTGSTVNFNGSFAQTIPAFTFFDIVTSGSGAKTLSGSIIVNNNLTISSNLDVSISNYSIDVKQDFINNGTFTAQNGKVTLNGAIIQAIAGQTNFYNLTINNNAGVNLNLSSDIVVNNNLEFMNGNISTNANIIEMGMYGNVIHLNGFVNGSLKKYIPVGGSSDTSCYFTIGSGSNYTPIVLDFDIVTTAGYITVKSVGTDHPNISTSGLDSSRTVNRHWDLTNNGVVFNKYSVGLQYVSSDRDPGLISAYDGLMLYSGGAWQYQTENSNSTNYILVSDITSIGSFQIGLIAPKPALYELIPAVGYLGQTLDVSFVGGGFVTGMSYINSLPGITVNSVTVNSDTLLTANITVSSSAAIGDSRLYKVNNALPGGGTTDSLIFSIKPRPVANFYVESLIYKIQCKTDGNISFTNTSINGVSYLWDFGLGAIPATANGFGPYTVSYSTTGYKTIKLIAINPAGNDTLIKTNYINVTSLAPAKPLYITGPTFVCSYGTSNVNYNIPGSFGATNYTWSVPAGVNIISGQGTINLIVSFTTSFALGNISVIATNACGNSLPAVFTVARKPMPGPITGTKVVCDISSTTYSVAAVTGATSYNWTVPTGINIVSGLGTRIISVSIDASFISGTIGVASINACGTSALRTATISILPPIPGSITGNAVVCGLSSATYSIVAVTGATSYSWTVPTGMTITSGTGTRIISVNIDASFVSGNLSVAATNSCGSSALKTIVINTKPAVPSVITGPAMVCSIFSATYSIVAITGATSYNWTVPTGMTITSGAGTRIISVNIDASFVSGNLSVAAANSCGSSALRTIMIYRKPAVPSAITGPAMLCGISSATYSIASVTGATSYNWTVPTGVTIVSGTGTTSISVNIDSIFVSGNLSVAATNSCGSSALRTIMIYRKPAVPSAITGPAMLCGISSATYSIASVTGATSYNWTVPTGVTIVSGTGTTSISVNIDSTFVSGNLSVASINSCGSSALKTLAIYRKPLPPAVITGPAMVCGLSSATYSIAAVTGATSYNWTVPIGITIVSGQGTTSISVSIISTFSTGNISAASLNTCGSSALRSLALYTIPKVPGTISGSTNVCGITSTTYSIASVLGATSYNWTPPAGVSIVSGQGTTSVSVNIDTAFSTGSITVSAVNGCGTGTAKSLALSGCLGMSPFLVVTDSIEDADIDTHFSFTMYPNPSDGFSFNLELTAQKNQDVLVTVYDITGKENYSKIIITEEAGEAVFAIDPSNRLSPGIYIITATSRQNIYSKKLIVR